MPQRRSHTKSRGGCNRCKKRRIKCDESGPPCTICKARDAKCEYPGNPFRPSNWSEEYKRKDLLPGERDVISTVPETLNPQSYSESLQSRGAREN
ncbi:uncharacterized protein N7529_007629 [Penicillium soppii]|uniref:uncharacterized protein n=1 Tax=Penicillium soppii TaxID=69789 RepID=UPI0025476583|nr:uncharacterized protein N7529_007629 [Penicillium soppii]KAJ5860319.1 hypothetical protein N7529_007629 [Penicillium soppii]